MSEQVRHLYEFGPFRLDATERLLLRDHQHIPLTPKAFETLLVLVEHGGHVIDKDELMRKVWPDTFVEEVNLAKNVSSLRKILGAEQSNHYIETIPKRGYRFVAGVREVWSAEPSITTQGEMLSRSGWTPKEVTDTNRGAQPNGEPVAEIADFICIKSEESRGKRSLANRFGLPLIFVTLGAIVAFGVWFLMLRSITATPAPLLKITPLTSFSGNEDQAAFSPDGNQIAFVWNGEKEDNSDIYVKMIGAEQPLRLTANPAPDTDPTWSPDARYVAFLRQYA
jgi:DNA-binding winged helix-turn-helix (wHTH) protein